MVNDYCSPGKKDAEFRTRRQGNRHSRRDSDEEENEKAREDRRFIARREDRLNVLNSGIRRVWAVSPSQRAIEDVYALYQEVEESNQRMDEYAEELKKKREKEKKAEGRKRKAEITKRDVSVSSVSSDETDSEEERRRKKKHKKEKKARKAKKENMEKKRKKEKVKKVAEESEDEWIEMTDEIRAKRRAQEDEEMEGPVIPDHLIAQRFASANLPANYAKNMPRAEAEAFAAYIARGERIPRRGEIGLSSNEITDYERAGYVMSGTRHKAMEATRIRKENQIMTAEEKRLLAGFTQEERKKKEDVVLAQFRQLINSKRTNS